MSRMDIRLSTGQWYVHARVCSIVILGVMYSKFYFQWKINNYLFSTL